MLERIQRRAKFVNFRYLLESVLMLKASFRELVITSSGHLWGVRTSSLPASIAWAIHINFWAIVIIVNLNYNLLVPNVEYENCNGITVVAI